MQIKPGFSPGSLTRIEGTPLKSPLQAKAIWEMVRQVGLLRTPELLFLGVGVCDPG